MVLVLTARFAPPVDLCSVRVLNELVPGISIKRFGSGEPSDFHLARKPAIKCFITRSKSLINLITPSLIAREYEV